MTIAQAIELVIGAGGVGGAYKAVVNLTRLAVAVEDAATKIGQIIESQKKTDATVADHESRLNRAGH